MSVNGILLGKAIMHNKKKERLKFIKILIYLFKFLKKFKKILNKIKIKKKVNKF